MTDENYEKAWQKLVRKYEDPRRIAQALFNSILKLPKITKATAENLNANAAAALETRDHLIIMTGLSKESISKQMIVHLLRKSLDAETLRAWELKLGDSKDFSTLEEFTSFNAYVAATQQREPGEPTRPLPKEHCAYCKGPHLIANCQRFVDLSPIKRNEFMVSTRLCFNCLDPHLFSKCRSTKTCFTYKRRHHTLIHGESTYTNGRDTEQAAPVDQTSGENPQTVQPGKSWAESARASPRGIIINQSNNKSAEPPIKKQITKQPIIENSSHHSTADQQYVLLATAQVRAQSPKTSFSKQECSSIKAQSHTREAVSVLLHAVNGSQQVQMNAHIFKKLTVKLPSFSFSPIWMDPPQGLQLAYPDYLKPGPIDIIGADSYGRIIKSRVVRSRNTQLVGQQTIFGWILSGPIECSGCSPRVSLSAVKEFSNEQLQELFQKFWHQEELLKNPNSSAELSPDEIECEKFFKSTHTRDETGRYIVRLPLRTSPTALGECKFKASRQFQSDARRFQTDESYFQLYKEFINEYEALGHMRKAPEGAEPITAYYLPHHGVLREDALTTKLRVVFNGSSPSSSGLSFNDILYPGKKL
ncbi:uncharacterized protein LOC107040745 [Diachasma alloeum]|uniref:uncharacterized protein LOC107040745 n=1 Tax=Diachasma alloeum TaxID=454923 RepID=UPI0007382818|nr:uncharacterized protein LOC107040745 [Diachasma alloeum]